MKNTYIALFSTLLLAASASASTIVAGGGTGGAQFYTSAGSILTNLNSTFAVGTYEGNLFTPFAVTDTSPIQISTVGVLAGRWSGNAADTLNTANPFNGQKIWFQVTTIADGGGQAYFSGTPVFPNNGGGVGDALTYNSTSLIEVGNGSSLGSRPYEAGDGRVVIGVIPEPSAALLGALGALGLLRRRRN